MLIAWLTSLTDWGFLQAAELLMSAPHGFVLLQDILLPQPVASLVAVLLSLGIRELGGRLTGRLLAPVGPPTAIDSASGFVLVAGLLAGLVHGLALAHLATFPVLRLIATIVASAGVWSLLRIPSDLRLLEATVHDLWRRNGLVERGVVACCCITLAGLSLAALGPPTDIDSLDYHLGVPLDWLRHSGAVPNPYWLHARLAGLGECLNLLGLAAGTDCFGAVLQVAGLLIAASAVASRASDSGGRLLGLALVLSCPVIVSLTTTQKPQLLPAAATTLALVMVCHAQPFDRRRLILACGCVGFAIGCKYSFLFSGSIVLALAGRKALRNADSLRTAVAAAVLVAVLAAPVYVRNFAFYGDPLSPCLESWSGGDPAVMAFAEHLREFGGSHSLGQFARLPVKLMFPTHPGRMAEVLGLGSLAFLLGLRSPSSSRLLLLAALLLAAINACVGQLTPRFFLEPYLWSAAAVVAIDPSRAGRLLLSLLLPQSAIVAAISLAGAAILFPGAWTNSLRDSVQRRSASTYQAARWLDDVLPADAVFVTDLRCHALLPRRVVPADYARFLAKTSLSDAAKRAALRDVVQKNRVELVVIGQPEFESFALLGDVLEPTSTPPAAFTDATRNIFNRGRSSEVRILRFVIANSGETAQPSANSRPGH